MKITFFFLDFDHGLLYLITEDKTADSSWLLVCLPSIFQKDKFGKYFSTFDVADLLAEFNF